MAEVQKITLHIADRVYPLSIHPDKEESLRKAAKSIEGMLSQFEQSYAVRDKQDSLAMCALQYATSNEQLTDVKNVVTAQFVEGLNHLGQRLDEVLASQGS